MTKAYLLDTNIVSEFIKQIPDERVLAFYEARKNICAISSVTWQEMIYGVERLPEGKRRKNILNFMDNLRMNMEIIPYDSFAAEICGKALAVSERSGKTLASNNSQIAATAASRGMVLVTRNVSDFEPFVDKAFLTVENWFSA